MLQKITTRPKIDTTTIGVTSAIAGRTIRITIFFILSNCGLFFMRNDAETNLMEI